jgi:hypothetical protein
MMTIIKDENGYECMIRDHLVQAICQVPGARQNRLFDCLSEQLGTILKLILTLLGVAYRPPPTQPGRQASDRVSRADHNFHTLPTLGGGGGADRKGCGGS